jgi:hypothetical protein
MSALTLPRVRLAAAGAGALGAVLLLAGVFFAPVQTARSYWLGWLFYAGLSFGAFAIVNLQGLVGGRWSEQLRRPARAAVATLPLVALLLIPAAFGFRHIFPWAAPDFWKTHELPHHQAYLQPAWFWLRALVYFAVIGGLAFLSRRRPSVALSSLGLVAFFLGMNFASTDWLMSLEPEWHSTIFGVIFMSNQFLSALALCASTALLINPPGGFSAATLRDIGNLLLAFVVFSAYLTFSQFLIIWSGNLPPEISWYMHRRSGGWPWVALVLGLCQFLLPFALLLSRALKQKPHVLTGIALFILLMNAVHWFWLVVPAWHPEGIALHWLDVAAFLGLGGIWLNAYLWQLGREEVAA